MSQEHNKDKMEMLKDLIAKLKLEYPLPKPMLNYNSPYELLVAVSLSAQTTDLAVNRITPQLFERWPDAYSLALANNDELEDVIHSLGFFRQKARNLTAAACRINEEFNGLVPKGMEDLTSLPGVGRKSANVIRAHIWGRPGIIVDTHFGRVCWRFGLTSEKNSEKVEKQLLAIVPEQHQIFFSMAVNLHGRQFCKARLPLCFDCPLNTLCPRVGLTG